MVDGVNKKKVITNLIWRFAERCGAQGVGFVITIILARILMPEEFGTVALMSVFINIMYVFVDCGLSSAVIQKKNVDELDFSCVFIANIVCAILSYAIIFITSPLIASFYADGELVIMMRIMGISLIISSLKSVQQAYVTRKLLFKKFFFSTLVGTIVSGIIGIVMAYCGFGVWALIAQNILNTLIDTLMLWLIVGWHPKFQFSFERFRELFAYGGKLLLSGLIDTLYTNLQSLVIGKKYTETDLAYYSRGKQVPELLITNINSSLDSVLFPIMSGVQEEKDKLKSITRKALQTSTSFLWPILAAVIAGAPALIEVFLTNKWMDSVVYMRIFCLSYAFWPIHTANLNAIKAYGKSGIFLKLEIIKNVLGLIVLLLVFNKGVNLIAISGLILAPICALINWFPNRQTISYQFMEVLKDTCPAFIMSVFEFCAVIAVSFLSLNVYLKLFFQVIVGVAIYFLMLFAFKRDMCNVIIDLFRNKKGA